MSAAGAVLLNPRDLVVLAAFTGAASAGLPCPSNEDFALMIGAATRGAAVNIIRKLRQCGLIAVEHIGRGRRVTILQTGAVTAPVQGKRRDLNLQLARQAETKARRRPVLPSLAALAEPLATVDREPCFRCGARGDFGCKHRPSPSGAHSAAGSFAVVPPLAAASASISLFHG
jgi:hypothetical protein